MNIIYFRHRVEDCGGCEQWLKVTAFWNCYIQISLDKHNPNIRNQKNVSVIKW